MRPLIGSRDIVPGWGYGGEQPPCCSFSLPALLFAERGQQGGFESFFIFKGVWGQSPHAFLFSFPPCCSRNAGNRAGMNLFLFSRGFGGKAPMLSFFFLPSLLFAARGQQGGFESFYFPWGFGGGAPIAFLYPGQLRNDSRSPLWITYVEKGKHRQTYGNTGKTNKNNPMDFVHGMGNGKNRLGSRPLRSDPSREKAVGRRPTTRWGAPFVFTRSQWARRLGRSLA